MSTAKAAVIPAFTTASAQLNWCDASWGTDDSSPKNTELVQIVAAEIFKCFFSTYVGGLNNCMVVLTKLKFIILFTTLWYTKVYHYYRSKKKDTKASSYLIVLMAN